MARKISVRTVMNRKALTAIRAGYVDGLEALGQTLLAQTVPLDDPATAKQIMGDWGIWADGKKVAGTAAKPRRESVKSGLTLLVGFDFPMKFGEIGTIKQPARPRFSPVLAGEVPGSGRYLAEGVRNRARSVK